MKKLKWIVKLSCITITALILTTACQQQKVDPVKAEFQAKADQVLGQYTQRVSASFANSNSSSSQSRGFFGNGNQSGNGNFQFGNGGFQSPIAPGGFNNPGMWNGWNPFGNSPFGGQVIQQDMRQQTTACVSLVANVPPIAVNFQFMIGSLARCLDMMVSYRNPIMSYSYRNLSSNSQQYWAYLQNFRRPGTFNSFPSNTDFGPWNTFSGNGTFFNGSGVPF